MSKDLDWVRTCQWDYAYTQAANYYMENGVHQVADAKAQRCIEMGRSGMSDMCKAAINAQYPRPDIAAIATAHNVDLADV